MAEEVPTEITPIAPGYVGLVAADPAAQSSNDRQTRRPVIGVAKHSKRGLLACILSVEGLPQFHMGPVHVDVEPAGDRTAKALADVAAALKGIQTTLQNRK